MTDSSIEELLTRAEAALAAAAPLLMVARPVEGDRARAEAVAAGAPSVYRYRSDVEQLLKTLDIAAMAITTDPSCGAGYALAAQCLFRLGFEDRDCFDEEALGRARQWAKRATALQPALEAGWEVLAQIECYAYEFKSAEKVLGHIFKRFGDAGLYARAAFLFFRLQADIDQAINWGALAWQQEENELRLIETLYGMGTVYEDSGRLKHAYDTYRMICEKDPANSWGHFLLARVTHKLGGAEPALELIDKAIKLEDRPEFRALHAEFSRKPGVRMPGDNTSTIRTRSGRLPASAGSGVRAALPAPPPADPGAPRLPRKRKKYYG